MGSNGILTNTVQEDIKRSTMIHWCCEECLVRAICDQPCEEVKRHETMIEASKLYGVRWANAHIKQIVKDSPFLQFMERTGRLCWIEKKS